MKSSLSLLMMSVAIWTSPVSAQGMISFDKEVADKRAASEALQILSNITDTSRAIYFYESNYDGLRARWEGGMGEWLLPDENPFGGGHQAPSMGLDVVLPERTG